MLSLQKPLGVLRFAMRESDCPGLRVTVTSGEPSLSGPRMQLACGCWALLATLSGCGGYLRWLWTQNFSDLSIWNLSIHLSERAPSFPPWILMLEGLTESRWHNDMDFILCPKTSDRGHWSHSNHRDSEASHSETGSSVLTTWWHTTDWLRLGPGHLPFGPFFAVPLGGAKFGQKLSCKVETTNTNKSRALQPGR